MQPWSYDGPVQYLRVIQFSNLLFWIFDLWLCIWSPYSSSCVLVTSVSLFVVSLIFTSVSAAGFEPRLTLSSITLVSAVGFEPSTLTYTVKHYIGVSSGIWTLNPDLHCQTLHWCQQWDLNPQPWLTWSNITLVSDRIWTLNPDLKLLVTLSNITLVSAVGFEPCLILN